MATTSREIAAGRHTPNRCVTDAEVSHERAVDPEHKLARLLNETAVTLQNEWKLLVQVGYDLHSDSVEDVAKAISRRGQYGVESIKRKLHGIQKARALGHSAEDIIKLGQEKVLGMAQQERRAEKYTQTTTLIFRGIAGSQKELIQSQITRVKRILNIREAEMFWDWWLSQLMTATDDEIRHSAGHAKQPTMRPKDAPKDH